MAADQTTYDPYRAPLRRVDSAVNGGSISDASSGIDSYTMATVLSEEGLSHCCRQPSIKALEQGDNSIPLQFLVVDDPQQLKDKARLRAVRQHVMHNYLERERQKPASTDIRITKAGHVRGRRKAPLASPARRGGLDMLPRMSVHQCTKSAVDCRATAYSYAAPHHATSPRTVALTQSAATPRTSIVTAPCADDIAPLIRGIAGGFSNSRYLKVRSESIPSPRLQASLGSNLQPFACWPTFTDTTLNIEQLKWSCSRKFGSRAISQHWVPAILQAKHAFLSTICISAAYDDIMIRGKQTPRERLPYGSEDRMKVRTQVLSMINEALADPETQTADATLIAVLQVLNGEIMGCDDRIMRIHQNGLHDLVLQRGGLGKLGLGGQLSSILTITMYLIAALRETTPRSEYANFTIPVRSSAASHGMTRQVPESPLYSTAGGLGLIQRAMMDTSPTMRILQLLHLVTQVFVRQNNLDDGALPPTSDESSSPNTKALRDEVFALPSAEALVTNFPTAHARYQYESLRLTALVYTHALTTHVPLSTASAQLSRVYNHRTGSCNLHSDHLHRSDVGTLSWHVLIKAALSPTNLSECWGAMAGVLFFITLVAGACGNLDPSSSSSPPYESDQQRTASGEQEEARTWLAAVTVRCSILLSFEYGNVMLATLRRLVGIQQGLERGREASVVSPWTGSYKGPIERPLGQFSDFALDFMSGL